MPTAQPCSVLFCPALLFAALLCSVLPCPVLFCSDFRKKLIALVAQKFISDVAMDAMQFSRMRQASTSAGSSEAARKAASLKVNNLLLI